MSWECQVCARRVPTAVLCPQCGAMLYCSIAHARLHRHRLGHAEECERMRLQMARATDIAGAGLSYCRACMFCRDVSAPPSGREACELLEQCGVHRLCPFERICGCALGPDIAGAPPDAATLLRDMRGCDRPDSR
jgi:MYND finger